MQSHLISHYFCAKKFHNVRKLCSGILASFILSEKMLTVIIIFNFTKNLITIVSHLKYSECPEHFCGNYFTIS